MKPRLTVCVWNARKGGRGKMDGDLEKWKCPVKGCEKEFDTFTGLKYHFVRLHMNGECPICNKKFKDLRKHFRQQANKCEKHAILYGLSTCYGRKKLAYFAECRDKAYDELKVEVL
jgi:hypothetical protein